MEDQQKIKLLRDFAIYLNDRGLALDPEKYDYEKIAWMFVKNQKEETK